MPNSSENKEKSLPLSSSLRRRLPAVAVVISVVYAIILIIGGSTLYGAAWVVFGFLLTVLMAIMALTAGVAVLQALFVVAAELSLFGLYPDREHSTLAVIFGSEIRTTP